MTKAQIVGWAHSQFGKTDYPDTEALMAAVAAPALAHAGVGACDVDGIFVGVMNGGFSKQEFQAALVGMADEALARVPSVRLENACSTGSAAIYTAMDFIESGSGHIALVIGAEKMTAVSTTQVGDIFWVVVTGRRKLVWKGALRACSAASPSVTSGATATVPRNWR